MVFDIDYGPYANVTDGGTELGGEGAHGLPKIFYMGNSALTKFVAAGGCMNYLFVIDAILIKGTAVPNPRRSSACDCSCVLSRIDHVL